jgi:signal transduction histidine kinase
MKHRSLRVRLAGTLMGFSLLIAILFVVTTALWLSQSLERQFQAQHEALTELFAEQAFFAVFLDSDSNDSGESDEKDEGAIERVLESLVARDVVYAQIIKNGQVVAEQSKLGSFPTASADMPFDITVNRRIGENGVAYLDITRGLIGRSGTIGVTSYVRLGVSLASLETSLQQQLWTLGWIGLGITVVGAVLGLGIFYQLWAPIRRLTDAVKRFGKGDLAATASVKRQDELGLLASEFNQMASRIAEKNHELEKLNQELHKANRTKTEFLTVMSHELRTPLNAILGYAELLDQGKYGELDGQQRRPLRRLLRAGGHLLTLIENTLNYAKLELGVEKLHKIPVDAETLLVECLEQLQPLSEERGIGIDYQAQSTILNADPMKLKQILLNLIQNAIQHAEQGTVQISIHNDADEVRFEISDTGVGFDIAKKAELFEPFTRGEEAPHHSQSGVGLGLTVVDRYTRMHDGQIEVSSKRGGGTIFVVTIPKQVERAET